jgi:hypothetical protein
MRRGRKPIELSPMQLWQQKLLKAWRELRPRGERFNFYTKYSTSAVALWRCGGDEPEGAESQVENGVTWYGFSVEVSHEAGDGDARKAVAGLFSKFGE